MGGAGFKPGEPKILVLGVTSMIGGAVLRELPAAWGACSRHAVGGGAKPWHRVDVECREQVTALLQALRPDIVIHCAGVCDVAKCEAEREWAHRINVDGAVHVAEGLEATARLVYVSSDHVFGDREGACGESTPTSPVSRYGETRVEAERAILARRSEALVIRPGLPIGRSLSGRTGHVDWLRRRHALGLPMTVVKDEIRTIVSGRELGRRIAALSRTRVGGIRHVWSRRVVGRVELAQELALGLGICPTFHQSTRREQPAPHVGRIELCSHAHDDYATPIAPMDPGFQGAPGGRG